MALNIEDAEVERLVIEVSELTRESKTEAIRKALEERKLKLTMHAVPHDRGMRPQSLQSGHQRSWKWVSF